MRHVAMRSQIPTARTHEREVRLFEFETSARVRHGAETGKDKSNEDNP